MLNYHLVKTKCFARIKNIRFKFDYSDGKNTILLPIPNFISSETASLLCVFILALERMVPRTKLKQV